MRAVLRRARRSTPPGVVFLMPQIGPVILGRREVGPGGAETQIWLLATTLASRGRPVAVVAREEERSILPSFVQGVRIVTFRAARTVPARREALVGAAAMMRSLRAVDAPVLVQRSAGVITGLAGIAALLGRRRFVYSSSSVVDFSFERLEPSRRAVALFHLGVRLAETVVVQTPEQVELCRERFGREPVLIKSLAEPQPAREGEPEAFLWVGRLAHYKRPEAFVELARAVPEGRFWIVPVATGRVELGRLEELRSVSEELPNLELHDPRPREQLGELIARSVAVVSTTYSEGMPNVFLEGWARGVPALALSHDPDGVISRERVGAFAGGSGERFAELARAMWTERNDQRELALSCRDYVAREHSIEAVVERWEHVLGLRTATG